MTRDNVAKRKSLDDKRCLLCDEEETVDHLFFQCVVAKQMWLNISETIECRCGDDFESVGKMWLSKKNMVVNIFTSAALWGLWKLRNYICFQDGRWKDVQALMQKIAGHASNWAILCPSDKKQEFELKLDRLKSVAGRPGRLTN